MCTHADVLKQENYFCPITINIEMKLLLLCRWSSVTQLFSSRWLSASHLSKWAWSKWYFWHSKVCFLSWPSHWNRQ